MLNISELKSCLSFLSHSAYHVFKIAVKLIQNSNKKKQYSFIGENSFHFTAINCQNICVTEGFVENNIGLFKATKQNE